MKSKVQSPRSKVQSPRSKVQSPKSKVHRLSTFDLRPSTGAVGCAGRAGFSLIEVMVATTILIIIVLMVTMVFQQGMGSWSSGSRRADSQMIIRTIVGSIQRDLVNAIPDDHNVWNNNKISFLAVIGKPEGAPPKAAAESAGTSPKAAKVVTYSYGNGLVSRQVKDKSGKVESETNLNESYPLKGLVFDYPSSWSASGGGLPPRVDVKITVKTTGADGLVSAHSLGPDGRRDTDDDIYVGGRQ